MQPCPVCDTDYDSESPSCPECGGDEHTVHRCARCGESYRLSRACPACGTLREATSCATHPERQAPGRCVICGKALCPDCGASGDSPYLCETHRGVRVTEGWSEVYTTPSELTAQLLRDNLRAEGIDAQIFSQRDKMFSVELGELSIVRLLVPVWNHLEAVELIRGHTDYDGEVGFACPNCGEAFESEEDECKACGSHLR